MPKDTDLEDYQLLPADDPEIDSEQELEEAFIDPEGDPEIDAEFTPPTPIPYGRSWQYDIGKGRCVRYGQRPAEIFSKETLKQWIHFVLNIEAGAHSIFPEDFGMDDPFAWIGQQYSPALEADFQQQVQTALLFHDRIVSVDEFRFFHDDNDTIIYYEFTVHTDDEEEFIIQPPFEVPTTG